MEWLSRLFNKEKVGESGREPHTRAMGSKNKRAHRGGELKRKILDAISKFDGEFTTREITKASGYTQSCGHTGIANYLREFEKKGLIECVTVGKRRSCDPLVWRKKTAQKATYNKFGKGELAEVILQIIQSSTAPMTINDIRESLGRDKSCCNDSVYASVSGLLARGLIHKAGKQNSKGNPILFEAVQPTAKPVLVSKPVTVPFYYDAEFRVVAKRDKRLIALIEQKKKDAMGNDKWEPAETDIRLYQQALKAVCGHLLAPNGVM